MGATVLKSGTSSFAGRATPEPWLGRACLIGGPPTLPCPAPNPRFFLIVIFSAVFGRVLASVKIRDVTYR